MVKRLKENLRSNSLRSNECKLFYAFNSLYEQTSNYKRLGWILLQSIPSLLTSFYNTLL